MPGITTRGWMAALLCAGLIASAAIYTYGLDRVPAYLTLDEAHFSVHAASIAATGRNLNGQIVPPLVSLADPEGEPMTLPWGTTYYLPFGMYLIAGVLQVLPLSEAAVRTPSALLGGVINVALIFAVGLALFRSRLAAAAAAAVLALSPANVIISRQALDSVCQVPFVLGGLWCCAAYLRKPDARLAFAAGAVLGCGIYAYITSVMFMPFYLAVFWLIAWRAGVLARRDVAWSIAGFAIVLLPMVLWLAWHPDAARSLQLQYNRADPGSATLMQNLSTGGVQLALSDALRVYWSYFDPTFLFIQGGNARNLSTGSIGVFLYPGAVLAAIGIYALREHPLVRTLLVIGLAAAPLPAAIKGAPFAIQRASGLLIFVSLVAGFGFASLARSTRTAPRIVAAALAAVMAWQFAGFLREYHGPYRERSASAYDRTAFGEVAASIMASDAGAGISAVYLPTNFYDVSAKWRFYTLKHRRADLWQRTRYFERVDALSEAAPHAVAVLPSLDAVAQTPAGWTTVDVIKGLNGLTTALVIRRQP